MTAFWIGSAVMLLLGLGWILPALWARPEERPQASHDDHVLAAYESRLAELEGDYRDGFIDAEQLEEARDDLDRELLHDVRDSDTQLKTRGATLSALVVTVVIGGTAFYAYDTLGTPHGLAIEGKGPARPEAAADMPVQHPPTEDGAGGAAPIEQMVDGLARRLQANPDDGQGWMMLGRSYIVLGRLAEARDALARAVELVPDSVDSLAAYAEVLGRLDGNRLVGRPRELLDRALQLEPGHSKSLWLGGIAAMQGGDAGLAIERWQALRASGVLNAEETATLDGFIAEARDQTTTAAAGSAGGMAAVPPPAAPAVSGGSGTPPVAQPTAAASGGVSVTVRVSIDPALAARVQPSDSLFVFARAEQGPPMPLAVQRLSAAALPASVTLDESMAMMPQMTLATFPRVVVGARISRSGNATPSPGDLQGLSAGLSLAETGEVSVVISDVVGG